MQWIFFMLPEVASTSRIWIDSKDKEDDYRAISSELFFIAVMAKVAAEDEWTVSLKTNGTLFNFKLDTGAQVKVLHRTVISALKKNPPNTKHHNQKNRGKIITGKAWVYSNECIPADGAQVLKVKNNWKDTWITTVPQNECVSFILKYASLCSQNGECNH